MGVTEFLSNIKIALGLSDNILAVLALIFAVVFLLARVFNYLINRIDAKDDKQFEVLYKIIDDDSFVERLSNQPFLIKQLFYRRFYLLKEYKVEEIEFLMSQSRLEISLYELSDLKSSNIIKFENGKYVKSFNILTNYWVNNFRKLTALTIIGFLFWIVIMSVFFVSFLESKVLFYLAVAPIFVLEIYLLMRIDGVKAYLRTKDVIDSFLYQSELFKNNQGMNDT
ncbi:hypothetical protein ACT3TH_08665 [Psychrobacter sp. AOP22-C1-C5]|uniref:hypothetical protein n=1 Tax=Psychrobacter sp. AOP22-C1-C5 TaxID=3457716 RepID=UPI0040370D7B